MNTAAKPNDPNDVTGEPDLFTPLSIGPYELRNRIVMAPLTRNRAGAGDAPTAMNAAYYRQRASAGMIITEGSQISPRGKGYPGTPGIHSADQIAGWRKVTDAVHEEGRSHFPPALACRADLTPLAAARRRAAGRPLRPQAGGRDLHRGGPATVRDAAGRSQTDEIPAIIGEFRTAAQNALAAGFDGVEVHAANGYLLDQFLRDGTNQRTDRYGGSLENRARLLLGVTEAV